MITLYAAIIAVGALIRWGLALGRTLKILDKPWPDVPPRKRVSTVQGVVLVIVFVVALWIVRPHLLVLDQSNPFLGLLVWGGLIALVSLWDELGRLVHPRFFLNPAIRLWAQVVAALCALWISGVGITNVEVFGGWLVQFGQFSTIVLSVAWFVLFINAINRFDGVYGLATGMSTVGFITLLLLLSIVVIPFYPDMSVEHLALLQDVQWVAGILAVLGIVYTMIEYKPRWLLRDVWTMFLGYALAYLALLGGAKIGTMIVVLALPLFDAVWVIASRIREGKNPLKGDLRHLQHRFLALGWTRDEIRVVIWGWSLVLMVLMLLQEWDKIAKVIIFVMIAVIFAALNRYLFWKKWLPEVFVPRSLSPTWSTDGDDEGSDETTLS